MTACTTEMMADAYLYAKRCQRFCDNAAWVWDWVVSQNEKHARHEAGFADLHVNSGSFTRRRSWCMKLCCMKWQSYLQQL